MSKENVVFSDYQQYIAKSRYSRYIPEEQRRETWRASVERYCNFFAEKYPEFPKDRVFDAIYNLKSMPSMRALMTAGKALERDNAAGYNCSYLVIDNQRAFDEAMYLLMSGCGVGYSVERQFISKLPIIADDFYDTDSIITVRDSKIGWASSYKELISLLYQGLIPKWDLSKLRASGEPLKIFGGRSSGPGPLNDLFKYTVFVFKNAAGRKLNSIECNDLMTKVGEIVVVGGVRRCLPSDTLVQISPNVWKEIKDMAIDDSIYLEGEYQKVSNIFDQGVQKVLKIELDDNTFIESTENHKWLVFNRNNENFEWIMTKDLKEYHGMVDPT